MEVTAECWSQLFPIIERVSHFILNLVLYVSVYEPYKAAFLEQDTKWYDWVIDMLFYADIVLTFHTGYDKGFAVEMDKAKIVKKYISGWFWIDISATVQWEIILGTAGFSTNSPLVRVTLLSHENHPLC